MRTNYTHEMAKWHCYLEHFSGINQYEFWLSILKPLNSLLSSISIISTFIKCNLNKIDRLTRCPDTALFVLGYVRVAHIVNPTRFQSIKSSIDKS